METLPPPAAIKYLYIYVLIMIYPSSPNWRLASNKPTAALTERFKLLTPGWLIGIKTVASQASKTNWGMPTVSEPNISQSLG